MSSINSKPSVNSKPSERKRSNMKAMLPHGQAEESAMATAWAEAQEAEQLKKDQV